MTVTKTLLTVAALGIVAGYPHAATAVVWSDEDEATFETAYSYVYEYGTKATVDTTNVNEVKVIDFSVPTTSTNSGAGYGIGWKQTCDENGENCKDSYISLSAYSGACVTYKALAPVRLDFKQSSISDGNFYGVTLPASTGFKSTFVAFDDLTQGWKSDVTVKWNVGRQTGVQFSYKSEMAKKSGIAENTVEVSSFILGDKCVTYPPALVGDAEGEAVLNEGDTLSIKLSSIFSDKDGDALVSVSFADPVATALVAKDLGLSETVKIVAVSNTDGETVVTLTADDGEHAAVTYELALTVIDNENAPVAVDDAYSMSEDDSLKVLASKGVLANDYDADEDSYTATLVKEPLHGTLTFSEKGSFTYVPNPDFYGTDVFTYEITEVARTDDSYEPKTSEPATVTITVKNVEDPAKVVVTDSTIYVNDEAQKLGTVIEVKEDFDAFEVSIPTANIVFTDPDAISATGIEVKIKSNKGIVAVSEVGKIANDYIFDVTSVANANGTDTLFLFAAEGKDTVGVNIIIKVSAVDDPPLAVADSFKALQGAEFKTTAKNGVLANDKNPDNAKDTLKAVLVEKPKNGKLELKEDGSFTYTSDADFTGEDSFTYKAVNSKKVESEETTVTITVGENLVPKVLVAKVDTSTTEDATKSISFLKAIYTSWFKSQTDGTLTYSAKSNDGKMTVTVTTASITIKPVKDSCGKAVVTVYATDGDYTPAEMQIVVDIAPVNDKPVLLKTDTLYVKNMEKWSVSVDMSDYVSDIDDDSLTYTPNMTPALSKKVEAAIKGDSLTFSFVEKATYEEGETFAIGVKSADAAGTYVTVNFFIVLGKENAKDGIAPMIAQPKATWQNAVMQSRGSVALLDMQGRVMWQAKLPVSEADVRNASAQVQGRKILRVNNQTWTVK